VITVDVAPKDVPAPLALINPEIIAKSEETAVQQEGCLSIPDQYADVVRPARVKVRYLDENWVKQEIEAEGLLAACLQHEIDHLNGVLFVDYLTPLKRNILLRKLAKAQKDMQAKR
jgi:peptide deformylase